jgi:hypothetical protein
MPREARGRGEVGQRGASRGGSRYASRQGMDTHPRPALGSLQSGSREGQGYEDSASSLHYEAAHYRRNAQRAPTQLPARYQHQQHQQRDHRGYNHAGSYGFEHGYRHEPQGYDESYESQTASRFSGGDNIGHYHQGSDYGYTGQWDGSHSDLHSNHSYRGHNQVKDGRTGNPSQPPGGASTAANSSLNSMSLDASSGAFQLRASAKEFVPSFVK